MEDEVVRKRRVDYGGAGACLLFLIIIFCVFFWVSPLAWLWFFLLIPPFGWGYGRVYYVPVNTVKTYERMREDPRSPRAGRDTPEGIEMTELKF